jgi:hypothetical protein
VSDRKIPEIEMTHSFENRYFSAKLEIYKTFLMKGELKS